jgi:hypothetical protein
VRALTSLALAAACTAAAGPPPQAPSADFYYFGGNPLYVVRSLTECVASFTVETPTEKQRILDSLALQATLGSELRSQGRAFHLVSIPRSKAGRAGALRLLELLRSHDHVRFAGAVFHHPDTRRRLVPTGEILVKLKPGETSQGLAALAKSLGLTISRPVLGTRDEFVLALARPKADDPVEKSRLLHESGKLEWAEPDFLQELDIERRPS